MFKVIVLDGTGTRLEYPIKEKRDALIFYMKQCIHHAEACVITGERATIKLQNEGKETLKQLSIHPTNFE